MSLHHPALACVALVMALVSLSAKALAQETFAAGDLYLVSACLPGAGGACESGVARISPSDWSSARVLDLEPGNGATRGAYDAFRDALVIGGEKVYLLQFDGTLSLLSGIGGVSALASDGRGRIYECASGWLLVYDATNTQHDLLDSGGSPVQMLEVTSLWYDRPTHSLIVGQGMAETATITRMPLSADGLWVDGVPVPVAINVPRAVSSRRWASLPVRAGRCS